MVREEQLQKEKPYAPGVKRELALAEKAGVPLLPYYEEGYDSDQLEGIRFALEQGVDIRPYLNHGYRGACIKEIAIGLKEGLDVMTYIDLQYTWRKMREIRLGIEQGLDVSKYQDPMYSYWQMREIRLGLKAGLDESYYANFMYTAKEMRKRRLMLKNRKNAPEQTGDWKVISGEDYDLCVSPDGLKAYLNWHCKRPVDGIHELEKILEESGIVYGVDHQALEEIAKEYHTITLESDSDRNTLVARGTAPKNGKDGCYEWKFQAGRKRAPKLKEDGTIDFDSLNWFDSVKKGEVLAVYHFAESAADGVSVYGKKIPAKIGREKETLTGQGFELLPDFRTYVAGVDGHVSLKGRDLVVDGLLTLDHLESSAQPFRYEGDVYILGDIEGPVTIEVGGDLVVDGFVQNAEIRCGGSLILKGGINNTTTQSGISVEGCVISRFFECVSLHAGGNIYFGTSLNSNLSTYGEVVSYGEKSGIIGGSSYSEKGFCVTNLGNAVGIHTTLSLGSNEDIRSLRATAESQAGEIKTLLSQLVSARNQVGYRQKLEKKPVGELLSRVEHTISEKNMELKGVNQKMEDVRKREERACQSRIIVEQQVFENVQIHYLNKKITAIPASQVEIRIHGDGLVMEKLADREPQTA
ncbi:MAG: DUF342 domain-containing protein [Agathobacter sp.]